ncbi:hypothetical protein FSP39_016961 [Pinctada imbricata]|uniref:Uncharacterized protein n=1 Tax=Pinctada imbricata TaxID=66713 RepID=A0AA88YKW8_PINIB|nr:hypothetical protein FSP39_016961 [Pinctada imbricata]
MHIQPVVCGNLAAETANGTWIFCRSVSLSVSVASGNPTGCGKNRNFSYRMQRKSDMKELCPVSVCLFFSVHSFITPVVCPYPVDLFKSNIRDEVVSEEHGMTLKEAYKMVDHRLLERALHRTCNLHSGDWNMNVVRKALYLVSYQALTFEEIYNTRLAYQAFEAFDMKGMLMDEHIILRSIKMCGRSIAPLKLMHRLKHMAVHFEDKTRIQLAEYLGLVLWCGEYKEYTPDDVTADNTRDKDLFKLVDFERLLSHHDHRLAQDLDKQYLEEEWDFGKENLGSKKMFKEPPVICAHERIEMARRQKKLYRHLKKEITTSQKSVYRAKAGFVRERPLTAPDLSMYREKAGERDKGPISAQTAYEIIQRRVNSARSQRGDHSEDDHEKADRPRYVRVETEHAPRVVSQQDLEDAKKKYDDLVFDMATLEKRYQLTKEQELNYYIPGYSERDIADSEDDIMMLEDRSMSVSRPSTSPSRRTASREAIQNLAYPEPKAHNSHARACDARFRGWHKVKTKKGDHFILTSPTVQLSYKGINNATLVRKADAEVKKVRGKFAHRYTKKSDVVKSPQDLAGRPFTAPAAMQRAKALREEEHGSLSDSCKTVDTGYSGSSDERVFDRVSPSLKGHSSQLSEADSAYGSKSPLSTLRSRSPASTFDAKSPILAFEGNRDGGDSIPRSTHTPREESERLTSELTDQMSERSVGEKIVEKSRNQNSPTKYEIVRKKSGKPKEIISVDHAPIPYMQHSKPKVVSVGGIGKISLLEDISESQYWEDLGNQDLKSDSEEEDECFIEDAEEEELDESNKDYEPRSKSEASLDITALQERKEYMKLLTSRLNGEEAKVSPRTTKKGLSTGDIAKELKKEKEAAKNKRNTPHGSLFVGPGILTPRKERRTSSKSSSESETPSSSGTDRENVKPKVMVSVENNSKSAINNVRNLPAHTRSEQKQNEYKITNLIKTDGSRKVGMLLPTGNRQNTQGNDKNVRRNKVKFQRLVQRMEGDISDYMATRLLSGKA